MRDMTEEETKIAQQQLTNRLTSMIGVELDDRAADKVDEAIKDHRQRWRLRGINFPPLVAIILPKIGQIDVVFREMDVKGIETVIVNLTRKYPHVTREDIAFGIGRAFPDYLKKVMGDARVSSRLHKSH